MPRLPARVVTVKGLTSDLGELGGLVFPPLTNFSSFVA